MPGGVKAGYDFVYGAGGDEGHPRERPRSEKISVALRLIDFILAISTSNGRLRPELSSAARLFRAFASVSVTTAPGVHRTG